MSFTAKYDGLCADCKEPIEVGDHLQWSEDRAAVHVDCAQAEKREAKSGRPTCPKCWQVVAVNGACGCDPE